MIRVRPATLSTHALERRPPVVAVLDHAGDRALIGFGLALAHGRRTRLRAWALHGRGEDLPLPLKMAMFGLDPRNEADRAVRHLVGSARTGAHVAVRVLGDDDALAAQALRLAALDPGTPLIAGAVRGRPRPDTDRLRPLLDAHRGPIVVLDAPAPADAPAFAEILAVLPDRGTPGHDVAAAQAAALERGYPTYAPRGLHRAAELEVAAKDCTPDVLTLIGLPSHRSLGPLNGRTGPLSTLSPGPVAVVVPPGPESAATAARLLK